MCLIREPAHYWFTCTFDNIKRMFTEALNSQISFIYQRNESKYGKRFLQLSACITWLICLFAGSRNKINWSSVKSSVNSCFSYPAVTQQHDYSCGVMLVSPDGYSISFSSFFGLLHLMRGIKEMMVIRTCIMFLFMDFYPLVLSFVAAGSDNSAANTACFIFSPKINFNFSLPVRLQTSGYFSFKKKTNLWQNSSNICVTLTICYKV